MNNAQNGTQGPKPNFAYKAIIFMLLLAFASIIINAEGSMPVSEAAVAKAIAKRAKKPAQKRIAQHASSSPEILEYLKKRPFFSLALKDMIIRETSTSSMISLADEGLYPLVERKNNKWEDQTNYYNGKCDNENLDTWSDIVSMRYLQDQKTRKINSIVSVPTAPTSYALPVPLLSYVHFSTSTGLAQMQLEAMKNVYYFDDEKGYTYGVNFKVWTYSPECANWTWGRIVFQNESIPGYSYGIMQGLPVGGKAFERRGFKTVNGNDVRVIYLASEDGYKSNMPVFQVSPFEGTDGNYVTRYKEIFYLFKKGNQIYGLDVISDRPDLHKTGDEILSSYFK